MTIKILCGPGYEIFFGVVELDSHLGVDPVAQISWFVWTELGSRIGGKQ